MRLVPGLTGTVVLRGSGVGTCELCADCDQGKVARSYGRRFERIGTGGFCPPCRQLATDVRDRRVAGAQLLHNDRVHVAGAAQVALAGGEVDSRLLATLATLCPLDVISFGGSEPGASAGYRWTAPKSRRPCR